MHVYLNSAGHCWEIMNGEICVTGMQQEASDYGDFDIGAAEERLHNKTSVML